MVRLALGFVLMLGFVAGQAFGQGAAPQQARKADPNNPWAMWDINQMIERATNEVAKRYNLTPDQTAFTRNLMATRVNAYLDKHEQKIRGMFSEVFKYQMAGQDPPAERVQQWTADITPMFDEAKAQIIEGNKDFREVLSDDQKKIHDIDLKVMEMNFTDAEKRLDRWKEGGFDPVKDMGRKPKPAAAAEGAQSGPGTAAAKVTPVPPAPVPAPATVTPAPTVRRSVPLGPAVTPAIDAWEAYVRQFIADFKLDATQSNQTLSILAESRKRADEYRASRKNDYQKLQALLTADPKNAEAAVQLKLLDKQIDSLFFEMKLRLDQIPTESQRKAFEKVHGPQTKPATVAGTSRLAASQPASVRSVRPITDRNAVRPAARPATPSSTSQPARQPVR